MKPQGDECSNLYHYAQQGRGRATQNSVLEQLRDMLLDAECGYGLRVERTLENSGAPGHLRTWRADLFVFGSFGVCVHAEPRRGHAGSCRGPSCRNVEDAQPPDRGGDSGAQCFVWPLFFVPELCPWCARKCTS